MKTQNTSESWPASDSNGARQTLNAARADKTKARFSEFDIRYVWTALVMAHGGGLAIASYLGWQLGTQGNLPADFPIWIQVHGQLQLVGWLDLFIMGVSLYFIPRLAGVPIRRRRWHSWVLPLTTAGLVGEAVARLIFSWAATGWRTVLRAAVVCGGIAQWLGLTGYIVILAGVALAAPRGKDSGLEKLHPFFLIMIVGWIVYATLTALFGFVMAVNSDMMATRAWNQWSVQVDLMFVLFPVAYAFSVRNFPHFLYLPPVAGPIARWGWAYATAALVTLVGLNPLSLAAAPKLALALAAIGRTITDAIVLWLIWDLNVFLRTRPLPYILAEKSPLNPNPPPKPWRNWFNHANWGRPEWIIRGAYVWLALGSMAELVGTAAHFIEPRIGLAPDFLRHVFLLGFITPLILGMAQKMVPGFLHKRRIAFPGLSLWIFVLINASVIARTLPWLLPGHSTAALYGLALSGPLALVALALFAWNLWATAHHV